MTKKDAMMLIALWTPSTIYAGFVIAFESDPTVFKRWECVFWCGAAIVLFLALRFIRQERT